MGNNVLALARPGLYASIPAWHGAREWIAQLGDTAYAEGLILRRNKVSIGFLLRVAGADARAADHGSGRNVATSNEHVAMQLGASARQVQRARRTLIDLGFAVVVAQGRYLTTAERRRSGRIRAASLRALTSPQRPPLRHQRIFTHARRVVLPRRGLTLSESHVNETNTSRGVNNLPIPIWLQRLAAGLQWRMPWLCRGRHIGALVRMLAVADLPAEVTADRILERLEIRQRTLGIPTIDPADQRSPIAYLRYQIDQIRPTLTPPPSIDDRLAAAGLPPRRDLIMTEPDDDLGDFLIVEPPPCPARQGEIPCSINPNTGRCIDCGAEIQQ